MSVDFNKIKVGDYVTVKMKVDTVDGKLDDGMRLRLSDGIESNWYNDDVIVTHEPRGLAVGDIVRFPGETTKFKIVAEDEGALWIKTVSGGNRISTHISYVERAE